MLFILTPRLDKNNLADDTLYKQIYFKHVETLGP